MGIHFAHDLGLDSPIEEVLLACLRDLLKGKKEGVLSSLGCGRLPGDLVWSFPHLTLGDREGTGLLHVV